MNRNRISRRQYYTGELSTLVRPFSASGSSRLAIASLKTRSLPPPPSHQLSSHSYHSCDSMKVLWNLKDACVPLIKDRLFFQSWKKEFLKNKKRGLMSQKRNQKWTWKISGLGFRWVPKEFTPCFWKTSPALLTCWSFSPKWKKRSCNARIGGGEMAAFIMGYPNKKDDFVLTIDDSLTDIDAIVIQTQEGVGLLAFASRTHTKSQWNFSSTEREPVSLVDVTDQIYIKTAVLQNHHCHMQGSSCVFIDFPRSGRQNWTYTNLVSWNQS